MACPLLTIKRPEELAPHYTNRSVAFYPLWELVPALEPFYTTYEKNYNAANGYKFIRDNPWFPLTVVACYLAFIVIGQRLMKNRPAFHLKRALAMWNLALAIFSAIGSFRVVSHLIYLLMPQPCGAGFTMRDTHCVHPEGVYADGATGLWAFLFTTSKCIELVDTVFVVLRKKPLIFLHWYHHLSVLLCAWFGHAAASPALYYMAMNYTIHAWMYLYFFLAEMKMVPKWFNPQWITLGQISQMFFGSYVVAASTYHKYYDGNNECAVDPTALVYLQIMYLSYMVLFMHFFVSKYFVKAVKLASPSRPKKGTKAYKELTSPVPVPEGADITKYSAAGEEAVVSRRKKAA